MACRTPARANGPDTRSYLAMTLGILALDWRGNFSLVIRDGIQCPHQYATQDKIYGGHEEDATTSIRTGKKSNEVKSRWFKHGKNNVRYFKDVYWKQGNVEKTKGFPWNLAPIPGFQGNLPWFPRKAGDLQGTRARFQGNPFVFFFLHFLAFIKHPWNIGNSFYPERHRRSDRRPISRISSEYLPSPSGAHGSKVWAGAGLR